MAYPPPLVRQYNFQQLLSAGLDDTVAAAKLDVELNRIIAGYNQSLLVLRGITTAAGALRNVPDATSLSLSSSTRFVATASQTAFTVPTYDSGVDTVEVWYGSGSGLSMLDPASITQTDDTTVTIPAQSVGAIVVILVFSSGAALEAIYAVDGTAGGTSGATLLGLFGDGLFISHTVEGGMVELMTQYNATVAALGSIGGLIRADGSVAMAADLDLGGFKVENMVAGTTAGDAVEYSQFAAFANVWNALQAFYLKLDGTSVMTGAMDFGGFKGTNALAGVNPTDLAVVSQLGSVAPAAKSLASAQMNPDNGGVFQAGKNAIINGGCTLQSTSAPYVAGVADLKGYGYVDLIEGRLQGTAVAGTLTYGQPNAPYCGSSGFTARWSVTALTGSGQVWWRCYVEALNARRFTRRVFSAGVKVLHDVGSDVTYWLDVYSADASDNFAAVTLIAQTSLVVPTGVETHLKLEGIAASAAAKNGVFLQVRAICGAVIGKTFDAADFQLETGEQATLLELEDVSLTKRKVARYYQKSYSDGVYGGSVVAGSLFFSTGAIAAFGFSYPLPVHMRITPTGYIYAGTTGTANAVYDNIAAADKVVAISLVNNKGFVVTGSAFAAGSHLCSYDYILDARF